MKKFFNVAFAAIAAIAISACGKSDDGVSANDLIGTWKVESVVADGKAHVLTDCEKQNTVIFTATTFVVENYNDEGSTCSKTTESGTYTLSGNTITIKTSSGQDNAKISKIGNRIIFEDTFEDNGTKHTSQAIYVKQ